MGRRVSSRARPDIVVQRVHYEDRSGAEFERMCFAHLWHAETWSSLEWYGQVGSDTGRDIWGVRPDGTTHCFQCANHARLTFRKAAADLGKVPTAPNGLPDRFTFIVGGTVSAAMRDRVRREGGRLGLRSTEVWSGAELEERMRFRTPAVLQRFAEGVAFPESAELLRQTSRTATISDREALELMTECFDRPAFTTPLRAESYLPDLKKAITDTIEALNTGIRRLRDGTEIGRIPRRHELEDPANRAAVAAVVDKLVRLRADYDALVQSGDLRACCDPPCGILFATSRAEEVMDEGRAAILAEVARVAPPSALRQEGRMRTCAGRRRDTRSHDVGDA